MVSVNVRGSRTAKSLESWHQMAVDTMVTVALPMPETQQVTQ